MKHKRSHDCYCTFNQPNYKYHEDILENYIDSSIHLRVD
jgi:hypothetical protein